MSGEEFAGFGEEGIVAAADSFEERVLLRGRQFQGAVENFAEFEES
jgi:hypothetical protein